MAKLVSKTYGDALFETACEAGRMDELFEEVKAIKGILETNQDFQDLMVNPKVMREEKENIIETTFKGRVSDEIIDLMQLMILKGRYGDIISVFEYFVGLVKEKKKIGIAFVTTAIELNESQKEEIRKKLLETTHYQTFEMNYAVDASLIGGMVVRIGDRVVDSSIRTKLYELSKNLRSIQV